MQFNTRRLTLTVLGAVLLGILLYHSSGFIHLEDFSGARLLGAVRGARYSLLLLSIAAIYCCYALRALRWERFSRRLGPAHLGNIYRMTLAGFSAVFLLGRAGEPVRPLLLARKEKLPIADMFGIYALERLFDTACTAVLAALGLFIFEQHRAPGDTASTLERAAQTTGSVLIAGVLAAVVFIVYLRLHGTAMLERRLAAWHATHGWRGHLARIVLGFARGVQTIRTWGDLAAAVFYSAAHWLLVVFVYVWVSHSFGGPLAAITFGGAMLVLAFTMVGSTLQLPGVGGGSQVASFLAYTAIFGVEKERAAAAAIVLWLITFAACSLAGVPLLIREGWSLGDLRRMAEQEEKEEEEAFEKEAAKAAATPVKRGESAE